LIVTFRSGMDSFAPVQKFKCSTAATEDAGGILFDSLIGYPGAYRPIRRSPWSQGSVDNRCKRRARCRACRWREAPRDRDKSCTSYVLVSLRSSSIIAH
jgi:hypothetical protein